jgi:arylsulfatase
MRTSFIYNLRRDPYERATVKSNSYYEWLLDRAYLLASTQA